MVILGDLLTDCTLYGNWFSQSTVTMLSRANLKDCNLNLNGTSDWIIPQELFMKLKKFSCNRGSNYYGYVDFKELNENESVVSIGMTNCTGLLNIEKLGTQTGVESLDIRNCDVQNLGWISTLTNLKYLKLSDNQIIDISALENLENIGKNSEDIDIDKNKCFYLNNNSITDITPLVRAIGEDGVINYKSLDISYNSLDGSTVADNVGALLKLHRAGLQKVTITGNNFTSNEIQDLINGKTIDGEVYKGFGEGNVIN